MSAVDTCKYHTLRRRIIALAIAVCRTISSLTLFKRTTSIAHSYQEYRSGYPEIAYVHCNFIVSSIHWPMPVTTRWVRIDGMPHKTVYCYQKL